MQPDSSEIICKPKGILKLGEDEKAICPKKTVRFLWFRRVKKFEFVEGERELLVPKFTKTERREADDEVDYFKENEMEIHENSVANTAIARLTDWHRIDRLNRRKIREYERQNRPAAPAVDAADKTETVNEIDDILKALDQLHL